MASLRDFSEYVHSQSLSSVAARRNGTATTAATTGTSRTSTTTTAVAKTAKSTSTTSNSIQSELDVLALLTLDDNSISGATPDTTVSFKTCLLHTSQHAAQLTSVIERLVEDGRGEYILSLTREPEDTSVRFELTAAEYATALDNLRRLCNDSPALDCAVTELFCAIDEAAMKKHGLSVDVGSGGGGVQYKTGSVLIRERAVTVSDLLEIRVAVVGNVDAGKSTLLGVLTKGGLDDGRGKARVNLFRYKHELETGRTSSVGMEIMGFDDVGKVAGANDGSRKASWKEIVAGSRKVITFIDLAGHEKYLKTTVFGLMGGSPDFVMLMVGANAGMIGMAKEHMGVALALNVPVFICITKIDMCPPNVLQATITQLNKILRSAGCRKLPIFIDSPQAVTEAATNFVSQRICPIFQISSVTGTGLDHVRMFLNLLPFHGQFTDDGPFEFEINDTFSVPFVGTVVSGVVTSGVVRAGDNVYIGPDTLGQFTATAIRSIERKRQAVDIARAGQSVSFSMKRIRRKDVRKGMVVLGRNELQQPPRAVREFIAEVLILQHATTIKTRYQAMLHVGAVAQTCAIVELDRPYIRTGDRSIVKFRFMLRPEYIRPGQKLLFREGRTRGLGVVKEVFHGV
ncbi:P-loop containing nucleoside triphosphate hydrolase protein [Limtongia smithiae]|uniref:P-loop containing nucleoside triphosphate hydrolase protein n=1 Tax=Limtongia smithiae TaxID=1125753 RepID=UPI0034CE4F3D